MPLRCPACKADNAAGPACRRCKADLSMLFALEEQRAAQLAAVPQACAAGNFDEALHLASRANSTRPGPDSQHWVAVLSLLAGNFDEAWNAYQTASEHA
jgi:hypothetical protein